VHGAVYKISNCVLTWEWERQRDQEKERQTDTYIETEEGKHRKGEGGKKEKKFRIWLFSSLKQKL
jgi:hypothetical protein